MLGTLWVKECKQILKSTTYYIFLLCFFFFVYSQLGSFEGVGKPLPNQEDYGWKYSDEPEEIMKSAMVKLQGEYLNHCYITYPYGFYKEVRTKEAEQEKIFQIIDQLLAANESELKEAYDALEGNEIYQSGILDGEASYATGMMYYSELEENEIFTTLDKTITYDTFQQLMKQVDQVLGGGSNYSDAFLVQNARVPRTYEDELKDYEAILYEDQVSRAYARLFCDYVGIVLGILPVFLAVTRAVRDRRSKASDVIYSKSVSATKIILSRYLATVVMVMVPVFIYSINPTIQSVLSAKYNGGTGDWFAFVRLIFGWLLPTVLVTVSVGFFVSELFNGPVAIMVQFVWWFVSIFMSTGNIDCNFSKTLIPRFNTLGEASLYRQHFTELVLNRSCYAVFGIGLMIVTIYVFHLKRRGVLINHGTLRKNRSK